MWKKLQFMQGHCQKMVLFGSNKKHHEDDSGTETEI